MKCLYRLLMLLLTLGHFVLLHAQTEVDERAMVDFSKGLGFHSPNHKFGINLRTRMQNRLAFTLDDRLAIDQIEARVSRLRLRFDGYINSKKLTYYIQLSFSRGDQDWDNSGIPNLVRDAMVYYHFTPAFYVGFGQGKLPGNRQRITSSGQQQFYDRSVANANFNLDRDFGLFAYYTHNLSTSVINVKAAISTGEGRNQLKTDDGLMYTVRTEYLPFGRFKNDGDFSEGDLEFEPNPKVSLAAGISYDGKATRNKGTTGSLLLEPRDMKSYFADFLFKYRGWALSSEYLSRATSKSAFTFDADSANTNYVLTGYGLNAQLSYCFPSYWELAGRYSVSVPEAEIQASMPHDTYYIIGVNKYLSKHLTKIQLFTGYRLQKNLASLTSKKSFLLVFQVELGI